MFKKSSTDETTLKNFETRLNLPYRSPKKKNNKWRQCFPTNSTNFSVGQTAVGAGNRKNDSSNGKDDGYATIPPDSIHSTITAEISNPTSNESSKKPITVPTIK